MGIKEANQDSEGINKKVNTSAKVTDESHSQGLEDDAYKMVFVDRKLVDDQTSTRCGSAELTVSPECWGKLPESPRTPIRAPPDEVIHPLPGSRSWEADHKASG